MKIASWNVNSLNVRLPQLERWLHNARPDVIALQETKIENHRFPGEQLRALGYHSVFAGQKAYNGVAILARAPLEHVQMGLTQEQDEQQRVIAATVQQLRIINLYVVNGQALDSDKYAYKLRWLDTVLAWITAEIRQHPRLIVLGDFNIAPSDLDVYDPALWNDDHLLTSLAERQALAALLGLGLEDSFRARHPHHQAFSWWDYRAAAFRRQRGLRIDLILLSHALTPLLLQAGIDSATRAWERPSDHAPAWIELTWPPPS